MILRANDSLGAGDLQVQEYGNGKLRFTFIRDNEFGAISAGFSITERDEVLALYNKLGEVLLTKTES